MLIMNPRQFQALLQKLMTCSMSARNARGPMSPADRKNISEGLKPDIDALRAMDLPVTLRTIEEMLLPATTYDVANQAMAQVFNTLAFELAGRQFYAPMRKHDCYYDDLKLFGEDVFTNFPSANNDIYEAGMCLAFERGTACVMHLMRVTEVGLRTLAKNIGVTVQTDWGAYLRAIDEKLKVKAKAGTSNPADEAFYREAHAILDRVRIAWRNPTMHVDNSYSVERAEEILLTIKSLMRHLATKISE